MELINSLLQECLCCSGVNSCKIKLCNYFFLINKIMCLRTLLPLKDKYNGPRQSPRSNFARRSHEFLFMNNIEFFKCHNIGHMARDCNVTWAPTQGRNMPEKKVTLIWRKKQIHSENLLNSPANNTCCWPDPW